MRLTRRHMIGATAALASIGASNVSWAASGVSIPVSDSPEGRFRAYMMMRGALDESLVIGYVSGSYFGVVDAVVTPLWDVVGATFARYRKRSDGGFDAVTGEIAHFLDPVTGEAPGRFLNPYTQQWVTDPRTNLPPNRISLLPNLEMRLPTMPPGLQFDHVIKAPEVRGDDIWITEVSRTSAQIPGVAKGFHYSEMVTMHARMSDLAKPDAVRVPCETNFTNVVDWRPWMNMTGHPGHLTAIGTGRYGVEITDLPERWVRATREKWPDMLENPARLLDPLWKAHSN